MNKGSTMKAFKNVSITKAEFLRELKIHQKADDFIRGEYNGPGMKGCAVGCSIKTLNFKRGLSVDPSSHKAYETHFGIPEWLAKVEDRIFEGVSIERSKKWPIEFIAAINTGSDLNKIKAPFLIMVLKSALKSFDQKKYPKVKEAIDRVIRLYKSGETNPKKFKEARAEASAAYAYAADAYAYAAYAADAAAYAADAAAYAADADAAAAAYAADAADAYAYAYAARATTYEKFADRLLKLMKACK